MTFDPFRDLAEPYALGALDAAEAARLEAHLDEGCEACCAAVASSMEVLAAIDGFGAVAPAPAIREQVLELSDAPSLPLDLDSYDWQEIAPGVRLHWMKEDPVRRVWKALVWARPGARHAAHRHLGEEQILVLKGALRDERGVYRAGDVCSSATGSVHSEEALPGEDCICYVVYRGAIEPVADSVRSPDLGSESQ